VRGKGLGRGRGGCWGRWGKWRGKRKWEGEDRASIRRLSGEIQASKVLEMVPRIGLCVAETPFLSSVCWFVFWQEHSMLSEPNSPTQGLGIARSRTLIAATLGIFLCFENKPNLTQICVWKNGWLWSEECYWVGLCVAFAIGKLFFKAPILALAFESKGQGIWDAIKLRWAYAIVVVDLLTLITKLPLPYILRRFFLNALECAT